MSTPGRSLQNLGSAELLGAGVPALEDRTRGPEAAGTEDMTPRGPEPFRLPPYITGAGTAHPTPAKKRRVRRPRPEPPPGSVAPTPNYLPTLRLSEERAKIPAVLLYIASVPAPGLRLARGGRGAGPTRTLRRAQTPAGNHGRCAAMGAPGGKINRPRTVIVWELRLCFPTRLGALSSRQRWDQWAGVAGCGVLGRGARLASD